MDTVTNSRFEPRSGDLPWSLRGNDLVMSVRLTPNGSCDAIDGIARLSDGRLVLKVRVRAVPEDGKANESLRRLLAKTLGIPARSVRLERGAAGRMKILCLQGDPASLAGRLGRLRSAV
jgi:uncharacterized protein